MVGKKSWQKKKPFESLCFLGLEVVEQYFQSLTLASGEPIETSVTPSTGAITPPCDLSQIFGGM